MSDVIVRPARDADLDAAARVHRLAFGTFFGLPDPTKFRADADTVRTRYRTDPGMLFVAEADGAVIGSAIGMHWGTAGILGPITVDPAWWSKGIARLLMPALVAEFDRRRVGFVGLFTHPQSTKHIRLYESYGFWPAAMTGVMDKAVTPGAPAGRDAVLLSALPESERDAARAACRAVAGAVMPGLDLSAEIAAIATLGIGDTLLLKDGATTVGFAACHIGAGSEAGTDTLYLKFAAVVPGAGAGERLSRLLAAAEGIAAARGLKRLVAGCNATRLDAYRRLQAAGYKSFMNGIAMFRPDTSGFNRRDAYVLDDWR